VEVEVVDYGKQYVRQCLRLGSLLAGVFFPCYLRQSYAVGKGGGKHTDAVSAMATPVRSKAGSAIMAFVVADGIATVDLLSSDEGK